MQVKILGVHLIFCALTHLLTEEYASKSFVAGCSDLMVRVQSPDIGF
jgi:hypothetical protein